MKDSIFYDKIFRIAFVISLISHTSLFLKAPNFSFTDGNKTVEITYLEQKASTNSMTDSDVSSLKKVAKKKSLELKITKSYSNEKEKFEAVKGETLPKKRKEKIVIKKASEEFQTEKDVLHQLPEFHDYYQYLRERIKQAIFYPRPFQQGEVLINFTLFCDGTLREVSIVDNLSIDNAYLRYAAIQSVKDASPFEPFPDELAAGEVSFQIFISFELSN